jgi:hypothetical protein
MTAAALLFGDSSEMCRVLLLRLIIVESSLGSLLCLSKVYTFLFWVVWLLDFTTIALHMS